MGIQILTGAFRPLIYNATSCTFGGFGDGWLFWLSVVNCLHVPENHFYDSYGIYFTGTCKVHVSRRGWALSCFALIFVLVQKGYLTRTSLCCASVLDSNVSVLGSNPNQLKFRSPLLFWGAVRSGQAFFDSSVKRCAQPPCPMSMQQTGVEWPSGKFLSPHPLTSME